MASPKPNAARMPDRTVSGQMVINPPGKFKRPKVILFDITGTLTQSSFVSKLLIPFFRSYCPYYLDQFYGRDDMANIIKGLRLAASLDSDAPKISPDGSAKDEIIASTKRYIEHLLDCNKENVPFLRLRFLVWFAGYEREQMKTPVYADVAEQIQKWRQKLGISLYAVSNGYAEANRRFMEKTNQGNLAELISGFYDTNMGELTSPGTYSDILQEVGHIPGDCIFLTHAPEEARAAISAGIRSIIVATHRSDMEVAAASGIQAPVIRSFNELEFVD